MRHTCNTVYLTGTQIWMLDCKCVQLQPNRTICGPGIQSVRLSHLSLSSRRTAFRWSFKLDCCFQSVRSAVCTHPARNPISAECRAQKVCGLLDLLQQFTASRRSTSQRSAMATDTKAKPALSPLWTTVKPFLNGGLSGMAATCVIQPIDMVKVCVPLPCW